MKRTVQWRWISWLEIVMMYTYVMLPVREMDCGHQIKEPPFDWAFHSSGRHNYWQAVRPSPSLCISSSSPQTELISQNQDRKPAATFHPPPSHSSNPTKAPPQNYEKVIRTKFSTGPKLYRPSFDDFLGGNHDRFSSILSEWFQNYFMESYREHHIDFICSLNLQI